MRGASYLQLVLQFGDRLLQALQKVPAQTRTLWAVHVNPGFHKPGHLTELGATRCEKIRQHLAAQPGTVDLFLEDLVAPDLRGRCAFSFLLLGVKDQLTALGRGGDTPGRRLASGGTRLGRLDPGEVSLRLQLPLPGWIGSNGGRSGCGL